VALTAITSLAGCGSGKEDAAAERGSPSAKAAAPTSAPASPTPTPQAADGTNLRACKDGTCEVKVTRPVRIQTDVRKLKVSAIRVTSLEGEEISFEVALPPSGEFDLNCDGDPRCQTMVVGPAFGSSGKANITAHTGAQVQANGITIQVVTAAKGSAILRMKPRKP
jgi:hypothetical protein